ncbi:MBL fold metallo-hydrolase [Pseudomonas sp. MAG733B]|uniref:MBL fold metallo-hydrolase n=1 Tax=Pseudomonas sp. MAG733B TaxID=3122079 RepID=UPI0030D08972
MRSISTLAGPRRKLDGGILFGHTPRLKWSQWMKPDLDNQVDIASRALLVQQPGMNILVLSGADALLAPPPRTCRCQPRVMGLLDNLAQHGLCEDDIDAVVLTHLHAPLSEELLERVREGEMPRLLFPKARYLTGERHWARARNPHPRDRDLFLSPLMHRLEKSGRLVLINRSACELLGEGWHFDFSDGFTPGQLLPEIQLQGGPVVFVGNLIPGTHWLSLTINSAYDRNPECVIGDKERLLDHLVEKAGRLVFSLDPDVAMVKVMRDRQSRYIPYDLYTSLSRFDT